MQYVVMSTSRYVKMKNVEYPTMSYYMPQKMRHKYNFALKPKALVIVRRVREEPGIPGDESRVTEATEAPE